MIETILFIAAIVIVYLVLYKVTRSIFLLKALFRVISIMLLVLVIVMVVGAVMVVKDANDFRTQFSKSNNAFILENNKSFIAAAQIENESGMRYETIADERLASMQKAYIKDDMDELTKGYYKVIVFDIDTLDNVESYDVKQMGIKLTSSQAKAIVLSQDAKTELAKIIASEQGISEGLAYSAIRFSDKEIKSFIFSYAIANSFDPKRIDKFIVQYKEGSIDVYKKTAMFSAIRSVPMFIVEDILGKQISL